MNNPQSGPGKNYRDLEDASWYICIIPAHQDYYDQLGACLICRVPTIKGLHPTARAALLAKRRELAHAIDPPDGSDVIDPEAETSLPTQTASASGSPNLLHWLNPFVQIVGHPGETT